MSKHISDEDLFFGDPHRKHRLGCTCWTLIIFFVLLLAAAVIFVSLAGRPLRNNIQQYTSSTLTKGSLSAQMQNAVGGKSDTVSIVLSQEELAGFMPNAQVAISTDGIYIQGKMMGFNSQVVLVPVIRDKRLEFEVKSVKIGVLPVPAILASPLLRYIDKASESINKELTLISLESVELRPGAMVLTGKIVGR